ncbi:hypothetical protein ABT264_19440 [Streptomyces virginiae]|uniref:hypothetical protein n=1 Tax=Streptomyces virginiae TaxID=1961 RepID=UPI003322672A
MAELVAAGAPQLPPNYFYRITETGLTGLRVTIRRQRRFWSTEAPDAISYVLHEHHDDAQSAVVAACRRAYERWQCAAEVAAKYRATTAFVGDHDPKGGRE